VVSKTDKLLAAPQRNPSKPGESMASTSKEGANPDQVAGEIERIVAEVDVFVKYGLLERATEHLRKVFDLRPDHVGARERLAAVFLQLSRAADAVTELETLAEHLLSVREPLQAQRHLRRALELDPTRPRARQLLERAEQQEREEQEAADRSTEELVIIDEATDEVVDIDGITELDDDDLLMEDADSTSYEDILVERVPAALALQAVSGAAGPQSNEAAPGDDGNTAALLSELEQVDFFLEQGLSEEARALLDDLDPRYANHTLVTERRRRLSALAQAASEGGVSAQDDPVSVGETGAIPVEPLSGDLFRPAVPSGAIPRAVVASGGSADLATHGDLGIAYKEMGLHDAALKEFSMLAEDPSREVFALTMMGQCYEEKGAPAEALVHYKKALNRPNATDEEATQIYYHLGRVFQKLGERKEALYYFEKVARRDPGFQDVAAQLSALRGDAGAPLAPSAAVNGRSEVSLGAAGQRPNATVKDKP
jgi:tetratricopeptide (TPR) repeat protein